ncbi:Putative ribonuclease H protein At1g65750 [Linum perenne]
MNVYLIPSTLLDEIEKMMNSFWWGMKSGGERGISWMRWERLCVRKEDGGMGFKDMHAFNLAMLGKHGWKLLSNPDALVCRVFKARYFPRGDFLTAVRPNGSSPIWQSIWATQGIVRSGYRWRVGDGTQISVWGMPWLRTGDSFFVNTPANDILTGLRVCDLLIPGERAWDVEMVQELFNERDAAAIIEISIHASLDNDGRLWHFSKCGNYTVRSGYKLIMESLVPRPHLITSGPWKSVWDIEAPPRLRTFLWRVARGVLPTRLALQHRHIQAGTLTSLKRVSAGHNPCRSGFSILLSMQVPPKLLK